MSENKIHWSPLMASCCLGLVVFAVLAFGGMTANAATMIGYWALDDATGTTAVDSIGGYNGAWNNGSTTPSWTAGILGGAVDLPGGNSNYFNTPALSEFTGVIDGMSISGWIKPDTNAGYRGILVARTAETSLGDATNPAKGNYGINHESSHIDARVQTTTTGSAGLDTANGSIPTGGWTHVGWVWDNQAGTATTYINGQPKASGSASSNISFTSTGPWQIGEDTCCNNRVFDGPIDDLAIYQGTLTATEVNKIYQAGMRGIAADAALDWAGPSGNSTNTVLADSIVDWDAGTTQPHGQWSYGRYQGTADWTNFTENPNYALYNTFIGSDGSVWQDAAGSGGYPKIGQYAANPEGNGDWAVRRWTSDFDGEVTVYYDALRSQSGGTGQRVGVNLNGIPLWSENLNNSNVHSMGNVGVLVSPGDQLDFIVDPNGANSSDWTHFSSRIEAGIPLENPGLIAHWALNETSDMTIGSPNVKPHNRRATVGDSSGNQNHMYTHATWSGERVDGLIDNALEFHNGTGYGVTNASDIGDGATELTLSMWIRPDSKSNWDGLLGTRAQNTAPDKFTGMALADYNSQGFLAPTFRVMNEGNVTSTIDTPVDEWSHVVAVWKSGETHRIYINGELGAENDAQAYNGILDIDMPWFIGTDRLIGSRWYDGLLDDIGIWNRALSEQEIGQLFFGGLHDIDLAHALTLVPEPSTLTLVALGLLGFGFMARRKRRNTDSV